MQPVVAKVSAAIRTAGLHPSFAGLEQDYRRWAGVQSFVRPRVWILCHVLQAYRRRLRWSLWQRRLLKTSGFQMLY